MKRNKMKRLHPEDLLKAVTPPCGEQCTCSCQAVMPGILKMYNDSIALGNCEDCATTHKLILQPKAVIAFPYDPPKGKKKKYPTREKT